MKALSFPVGYTAHEQEILNDGALVLGAVAIGSYAIGYIAAKCTGAMPRPPEQDAMLVHLPL